MKKLLAISAALLTVGCQSIGDIRQGDVWLSIPMRGTPVEAVNCLTRQFEAEGREVHAQADALDVYIKAGIVMKQLHPLYHIATKQTQAGTVAEIKVGPLMSASIAEHDARESVKVCTKA